MYLLQLFTLLFAVCFAWYSKIPILKMIDYGASLSQEKEFHAASASVRILFVVAVSASVSASFFTFLFNIALLGLVQWTVFDPALNIALGKKWYYIGTTSKIDRLLREVYDEDAGKWKAAICGGGIIVFNILTLL
jgi:hypothetical protein